MTIFNCHYIYLLFKKTINKHQRCHLPHAQPSNKTHCHPQPDLTLHHHQTKSNLHCLRPTPTTRYHRYLLDLCMETYSPDHVPPSCHHATTQAPNPSAPSPPFTYYTKSITTTLTHPNHNHKSISKPTPTLKEPEIVHVMVGWRRYGSDLVWRFGGDDGQI